MEPARSHRGASCEEGWSRCQPGHETHPWHTDPTWLCRNVQFCFGCQQYSAVPPRKSNPGAEFEQKAYTLKRDLRPNQLLSFPTFRQLGFRTGRSPRWEGKADVSSGPVRWSVLWA